MEFDEYIKGYGYWDMTNPKDIDNIAYYLYCLDNSKYNEDYKVIYIQSAFIDSVGNDYYYKDAEKYLRKIKIDNITKKLKI